MECFEDLRPSHRLVWLFDLVLAATLATGEPVHGLPSFFLAILNYNWPTPGHPMLGRFNPHTLLWWFESETVDHGVLVVTFQGTVDEPVLAED